MKHFTLLLLLVAPLFLFSQKIQTVEVWYETDDAAKLLDVKVIQTSKFIDVYDLTGEKIISLIKKDILYYTAGKPQESWYKFYEGIYTVFKMRNNKDQPHKTKEYRFINLNKNDDRQRSESITRNISESKEIANNL